MTGNNGGAAAASESSQMDKLFNLTVSSQQSVNPFKT